MARRGKRPDAKGDIKAKINTVKLSYTAALDRIKHDKNVGAYAHPDGLVFIDIDVEDGELKLPDDKLTELRKILNTFMVKTRNGGYHFYGINQGLKNSLIYYDNKAVGEIRADWQYVLLPGSYVAPKEGTHDATGLYEVIFDAPIKPISQDIIPPWLEARKKEEQAIKEIKVAKPQSNWVNELDMLLGEIRNRDAKLDALLLGPDAGTYSSRSEADFACASKLWFWRFNESQIAGILREHRSYEKTKRDNYLSTTVSKAIGGERYNRGKKNNVKDQPDMIKFRIPNKRDTNIVMSGLKQYTISQDNNQESVMFIEINDAVLASLEVLKNIGKIEILEETKNANITNTVDLKGAKIGTTFVLDNTTKVIKLVGKHCIFHIYIGDHVYECSDTTVCVLARFKAFMISAFSCVFTAKKSEFDELLMFWFTMAEEQDYGALDDSDVMKERMINYLNAKRIYQYNQGDDLRYVMYIPDKYPGVVWVMGDEIEQLFSNDDGASMRKISSDLSPLLSGQTKQFGSNPRHRYWQFSVEKCEVDISRVIESGIDE